MFKKSLLALAVLGSSSAFAATEVQNAAELTFATELFGTSDVVLSGAGVDVVTNVTDAVSSGAVAEFTYTLTDGTFGANPTLTFTNGAGTGAAGISLASGGQGESTVTFTVVVTEVFDGDEVFTLNVPSLAEPTALGTTGGTVAAVLSVENSNIVATGFEETITAAGAPANTVATNSVIATSTAGVSFTATGIDPMTGVDVDDQTQFDGDVLVQDMFSNVIVADTLALGTDGATDLALGANDEVTITITGNFATDSQVCLVADAAVDCTAEIGESTVTANSATITIAGDAAVAAADDADIIYLVDGEATVPTADFGISASVTFNASSYESPVTYSSDAASTLSLAGLNAQAERINIITKPGAVDETFIRVTNTTDTESVVYITLTTQDGATTVTGQLDSIAANATAVYTSADIATAVGVETWSGRGNAVLLTSAPAADIVVVPLVRTSGVLTNQASSL